MTAIRSSGTKPARANPTSNFRRMGRSANLRRARVTRTDPHMVLQNDRDCVTTGERTINNGTPSTTHGMPLPSIHVAKSVQSGCLPASQRTTHAAPAPATLVSTAQTTTKTSRSRRLRRQGSSRNRRYTHAGMNAWRKLLGTYPRMLTTLPPTRAFEKIGKTTPAITPHPPNQMPPRAWIVTAGQKLLMASTWGMEKLPSVPTTVPRKTRNAVTKTCPLEMESRSPSFTRHTSFAGLSASFTSSAPTIPADVPRAVTRVHLPRARPASR